MRRVLSSFVSSMSMVGSLALLAVLAFAGMALAAAPVIASAARCRAPRSARLVRCTARTLSLSLSLSRSRSSLAAWSRLCARPGAGVVCGRRDALMRAHRSPTRPACVGARVRVLHLKEPVRAPPRVGGIPIPWCSQRFQRRESPVPSPLHGGRGVTLLRPLWSGA